MNWKDVYNSKKVSIEDVLSTIKNDSVVVAGMTPMEPKMFLRNLHKSSS